MYRSFMQDIFGITLKSYLVCSSRNTWIISGGYQLYERSWLVSRSCYALDISEWWKGVILVSQIYVVIERFREARLVMEHLDLIEEKEINNKQTGSHHQVMRTNSVLSATPRKWKTSLIVGVIMGPATLVWLLMLYISHIHNFIKSNHIPLAFLLLGYTQPYHMMYLPALSTPYKLLFCTT